MLLFAVLLVDCSCCVYWILKRSTAAHDEQCQPSQAQAARRIEWGVIIIIRSRKRNPTTAAGGDESGEEDSHGPWENEESTTVHAEGTTTILPLLVQSRRRLFRLFVIWGHMASIRWCTGCTVYEAMYSLMLLLTAGRWWRSRWNCKDCLQPWGAYCCSKCNDSECEACPWSRDSKKWRDYFNVFLFFFCEPDIKDTRQIIIDTTDGFKMCLYAMMAHKELKGVVFNQLDVIWLGIYGILHMFMMLLLLQEPLEQHCKGSPSTSDMHKYRRWRAMH